MRAVRVRLLLGALFAGVLLFSAANAHNGDHGMEDLEQDDVVAAAEPSESPSLAVELPTFTVCSPLYRPPSAIVSLCVMLIACAVADDDEGRVH
jgi:hypothetical protein